MRLLPDVCRAGSTAATDVTAVELRFGGGFPGWVVDGRIERGGRYVVAASSMPNGPGPSWRLRERGCLTERLSTRVFELVGARRPDEQAQPGGHCIAKIERGAAGEPFTTGCAFPATATAIATLLEPVLRDDRTTTPACEGDSPCGATLIAGTTPHVHDTYTELSHRITLSRNGVLVCRRREERVSRRVEPEDAARALDRLAAIVRADGYPDHPETYEPFDDVVVESRGHVRHASHPSPEQSAALAAWAELAAQLPEPCRIAPAPRIDAPDHRAAGGSAHRRGRVVAARRLSASTGQ